MLSQGEITAKMEARSNGKTHKTSTENTGEMGLLKDKIKELMNEIEELKKRNFTVKHDAAFKELSLSEPDWDKLDNDEKEKRAELRKQEKVKETVEGMKAKRVIKHQTSMQRGSAKISPDNTDEIGWEGDRRGVFK